MAVYGRIEKAPETIQENKVDRSSKFHFENEEQGTFPFFELIIGSTIATIFSVVLPLLLDMLSSHQAQDLYIGWALHKGGQLYSDYYVSQGFLYYLLLYITQGSIFFALIEWLALLGGGYFLYRSADYLTGESEQAKQLLRIFYLLVSGLGFGGGYASILAIPFLFAAFSLVVKYFSDSKHDKGFLGFGILLGLSFFIDPLTSFLFIVVVSVGFFIFNVKHDRFAHRVYQFFASALGFSLAFYPLGYLVLVSGGAGEALSGMLYPIDSLRISTNPQLLENTLFYGLLILGLGGFFLIFHAWSRSKVASLNAISISASFVLLFSLAMIIFSQEPLHGSRLMVCLPILLLLLMASIQEKDSERGGHVRRRQLLPSLWEKFMKGSLYLPVLVIGYLIIFPSVSRFVLYPDAYKEQHQLVDRIKQETGEKDQIYIWDYHVQMYKESQRLSSSMLPSPVLYTTTEENKSALISDLKEQKPKVIVVNENVSLWSEVDALLKENYQQVKTDYSEFKVYKIK